MSTYKAPVEEAVFLLEDVLGFSSYGQLPGFAEVSGDVLAQILEEAGRLSEKVLHPLNALGDLAGCRRAEDGSVATPKGFIDAYRAVADGGWIGLSVPTEFGGQGLPYVLTALTNEFASSANMAFAMYFGLSQGAMAALLRHGSDAQKQLSLPKMVTGAWSGTMNLTEPQCGTDLGLLTTKATPNPDGSFSLTGQKIYISAGEHDLSENIVHLALARIEGAPAGVKGISLFLAPKFLINPDGSLGPRNKLSCGSIEHKMGIHGNATCVMNYEGARAELVGEPNRGLNAMFVMMNEARLGVANQGLGLSEIAYQNAADYARERLQGRSLSGPKNPAGKADPIIVHPDVRRMLLEIKCFNQAARALSLSVALDSDVAHRSHDPAARQAAEDRLGLLTPVLKCFFTERGFENAVKAQQVFGGMGYIVETGVEQFVRDARITMIYEGANGIQALDLVGRKLPKDGGRAISAYLKELQSFIGSNEAPELAPFVKPLQTAVGDLQKATLWLMQNALTKPDNAGAASMDYLHLFALVALGHASARIAKAALEKKAREPQTARAMEAKLIAAKFFMERMLPETGFRLARLSTGADTMMSLEAEMF
ncbi:acyl-CoA dehydrogenase C-terminal domain-containing protein [Methylocystis bryophila]|uniref:3-methylmercaptopropionyl-CoA dehydrogenase n=1 Tax=Methylocystis bryophila TaxID=655015 RepID=A0A1W6MWF6_9HYPH|nr:acyl-CoA dehydrogenase C-terminal domain-containing protein [Methylocystis bryophila]ARN81885.1 acyl-CoA dehydrogenase [Methylocystis bryophila]BDV37966.1 acyl-CoA dehydrogenase [Methylocystis bryophila]